MTSSTDTQTWVVMAARAGATPVLAWCRWTGGPGFDDIVLTAQDGMSEAPDVDPAALRLESHLFDVTEGGAWEIVVDPNAPKLVDRGWGAQADAYFDPRAAVITALTELGEDAVLQIITDQP